MKHIRNIILFLMCLAGGCEATMAQTPTSPVQLTTNTSYLEPSTHLRWTYNGATYGWYQVVDSVTLYTKSHIWRANQSYFNANILVTNGTSFSSYLSPNGLKAIPNASDGTTYYTEYGLNTIVNHTYTSGFYSSIIFPTTLTGNEFLMIPNNNRVDTAATLADISNVGVIPGGSVTTLAALGDNPGTNISVRQWIIKEFYGTQIPTASLSGGTTYELSSSGHTHNLAFSYGRQSATANIVSAIITGPLNVFTTNPSAPGTVAGNQSVTTAANTTVTYTLTVTTSDGKTATASTTDTYLPSRYWGYTASSSPSNSTILAVAGGGSELNNSRAKSGFTIGASGSNYVYYAYPASEGALTSFTIGGFESLPAFTQTTVSLTNASGYTQNYYLYVSNNTFSATTPTIITQ